MSARPAGLRTIFRWTLLCVLFSFSAAAAQTLNITSAPYNATTGSANNAAAIQAAINAVGSGGTVLVPSGTFLSGPITLKSNMTLQIASGATLKMTAFGTFPQNTDFIYSTSVTNTTINGSGVLDGQGAAWWTDFNNGNPDNRPPAMVYFSKSSNVTITGITVKDSPKFHVQTLGAMNGVYIGGVSITAAWPSPNTDGIDLRGKNYLIENSYISDGDDVIQIGGSSDNCQAITIRNCTFGTGHGLSIGGYTQGGVSNLLVDNCTFNGTQYGIRWKTGRDRGGTITNLTYSNITMTNILLYPFFLTSFYPNPSSLPPTTDDTQAITSTTPFWSNITLRNITASTASSGAKSPGIMWAVTEAPVSNVLLDGVTVTGPSGKSFEFHHARGVTILCNCRVDGQAPPTNIGSFDATITYPSCGGPTNTFTFTPTKTFTPTFTKTNTPIPPTNTFTSTATRTNTPVPPTNTFTSTATRTSTPTSTFSFTSTKTNTPVPPTATFTNTSTNSSTATRTNTPVPPTNTFTLTATPTASSTRTFTATNTSTNTNSPVPPSATPTRTFTATSTATSTNTSVPPTATPTNTNSPVPPTATFTDTNSPIPPSATATRTYTSTATSTNTAVPPTATFTSTNSPVPPTASPTVSSTPTATSTMSWTPTRTFTATSTSTATNSPVPPSATPTKTSTATSTDSATPTSTNSPIPPSATPTKTSTATSTNTVVPPTATFTSTNSPIPPSATPTASMTPTKTFTATSTNTSTNTAVPPTATMSRTPTASATFTGTATRTSTPTGTPTPTFTFTATASSTSTVTATPTAVTGGIQAVIYPNPVSGNSFNIQVTGMTTMDKVQVQIETTAFRVVNQLTFHSQGPGTATLMVPTTDSLGVPLSNGIYYVIVRTQGARLTLKLMVLR